MEAQFLHSSSSLCLTSFQVGDFCGSKKEKFFPQTGREGGRAKFCFLRRTTRAGRERQAEHLGDHLGLHMGRGEWFALLPLINRLG